MEDGGWARRRESTIEVSSIERPLEENDEIRRERCLQSREASHENDEAGWEPTWVSARTFRKCGLYVLLQTWLMRFKIGSLLFCHEEEKAPQASE